MTSKRIFVTGASGCLGHYIVETLVQQTCHDLFLLVRNPAKLQVDCTVRLGITVLQGDLQEIDRFSDLLKTMDVAVLAAAAWGGTEAAFDINVVRTIQLMNLLDPEMCQQVIYFSTESILNRDNQPLKEAGEIGTDYVRSKYDCHQQLSKLAIAPKVITLFPTLLLGGDDRKPWSHVSEGIAKELKWINLLRFFKVEATFHYIHSKDVAQVVQYLIDHPLPDGEPREIVLGNSAITADQAIEETCAYLGKRIYFRIPLSQKLLNVVFNLLQVQVAAWDRFCMEYRHFVHQRPVTPSTYGMPTYCSSFADVLKLSGVAPQGNPCNDQ